MSFKNKTIAVVGVSENKNKYGYKIFTSLVENDYDVYGVNPKLASLNGEKIYHSLSEIPKKIDLVITVVPPAVSEEIVDECHKLGINHIWFQPGSESEEAVKKAKGYGIETTEACFMVQNNIWK